MFKPDCFCDGIEHHPQAAHSLETEGDALWGINDSSLRTYGTTYGDHNRPLLTEELTQYLTEHNKGVGIDLAGGSNATALRELLEKGLVTQGLVTNFEDLRSDETKALKTLGHITGDLIRPGTWRLISQWKAQHAPEGFSTVLHRPAGALQLLPSRFYIGAIHTLIDWAAPQGVLLMQIPPVLRAQHGSTGAKLVSDLLSRPDVADVSISIDMALIYKSLNC